MRGLVVACAFGGVAALGSCATGLEPPSPTAMAEVTEGLTFTFGAGAWCSPVNTPGSQLPSCTSGSGELPVLWPQIDVTLQPFAIDVHEVTNFQYEYCVAAGGCTDPPGFNALAPDQQTYYEIEQFHSYPVVNITWAQADAYCKFVGKRLPTEYEWERVARGNPANGDRLYPVEGALADNVTNCQQGSAFAAQYCRGDNKLDPAGDTELDFVDVEGVRVYHLLGNAAEWVDDWYQRDVTCEDDPPCLRIEDCPQGDAACAQASSDCTLCTTADSCHYMCDDPGDTRRSIVCTPYLDSDQPLDGVAFQPTGLRPLGGATKAVRGGSVNTAAASTCQFQSSYRDTALEPVRSQPYIGFRCARSL